jgi:hypothetical protein
MQWVPNEKKEQPEEEPVCVAFIRTYVGKDEDGIEIWKEEPLYTAPPRREWVGLTEEERDHFEGLHLYAGRNQVEAWIEGVPAFIDAIEAKLREKNGG